MSALLEQFTKQFGSDITSLADASYREEPRGRLKTSPMPLLRPKNTQQVSDIVRYCNEHAIGIIPYGGGTGVVGGQVIETDRDVIILSVERMQAVRDIWVQENAMVVEAGAILADVQHAADQVDRLFPLSLGSEGSCRIGGNLATNAAECRFCAMAMRVIYVWASRL